MHYRPDRKTVGELLSMVNPPVLVPDWQRNFSWTTSEVDTFWRDLLAFGEKYSGDNINGQEYFLGSVVIVEGANAHLLLDGQQRLGTSAILLSVIRDFLSRYHRDAALRLSNNYLTGYDDASDTQVYKVTLNRYDRDFFRREILEMREGNYEPPAPAMESHRLIRKAREHLSAKFEAKFAELNEAVASHQWALRIQKVLTRHVSVVAVFSGDEDNAATVFETLNDRGIGLSTPDLLRNLLLRRAQEQQREEIIEIWRQILQMDDDVKIKVFLRHYWISHAGDVKTQSLYREIKDHLTSQNIDSLDFSRQIGDASVVYKDILGGNDPGETANEDIARLLKDINELDASVFYPAILSAFEVIEAPDQLRAFLNAIISVFVRHSVIGRLESSLLEDTAFFLAKNLRDTADFTAAMVELRTFAPDDQAFRDAFARVSITRSATVRYLLRELEYKQRQTEELEVAPPSRVHVEHIYPQTPPPEQRWNQHALYLNRLGNLTLLSRRLNVTIRNADFAAKRPYYEQSEIRITNQLSALQRWDYETIETRQNNLATYALDLWPLPEAPSV